MTKFEKDNVKEYLRKGGKLIGDIILEVYGESINQASEVAFYDAVEIGIENTVAALYDTDVDDNQIIRVLNKYWGISKDEAESRLLYEKQEAVSRELEWYLKMQGLSSADIKKFMKSNKVKTKISHNNELLKLRRNPEKLIKNVKEFK